jgi:N-acylglucosamine-6-phosphate 2-epimerase
MRMDAKLIVSCQPVPGRPLDNSASSRLWRWRPIRRDRLRCASKAANLQAVRPLVRCLIWRKNRDLPDSPVRITPWLA